MFGKIVSIHIGISLVYNPSDTSHEQQTPEVVPYTLIHYHSKRHIKCQGATKAKNERHKRSNHPYGSHFSNPMKDVLAYNDAEVLRMMSNKQWEMEYEDSTCLRFTPPPSPQHQPSSSLQALNICFSHPSGYLTMDGNASTDGSCNIDWDTDDDREIENLLPSSSSSFSVPNRDINAGSGEGCSSAVSAKFRLIYDMKFPEELVLKAIEQTGEKDHFESILKTVLSLQDATNSSSVEDKRLLALVNMDYSVAEATIAIDRCGPKASIAELTDFITAAQMAKADDIFFQELSDESKSKHSDSKRKLYELEVLKKRKKGARLAEDNETIHFPKPMVGLESPLKKGV